MGFTSILTNNNQQTKLAHAGTLLHSSMKVGGLGFPPVVGLGLGDHLWQLRIMLYDHVRTLRVRPQFVFAKLQIVSVNAYMFAV